MFRLVLLRDLKSRRPRWIPFHDQPSELGEAPVVNKVTVKYIRNDCEFEKFFEKSIGANIVRI